MVVEIGLSIALYCIYLVISGYKRVGCGVCVCAGGWGEMGVPSKREPCGREKPRRWM